jgi:glycosyltransferase involved in cell wall biosynthesis
LSDSSITNERIRVVQIIDRLNIGGPAKHVTWLTSGLDSRKFETVLITGSVPDGEGDMSYFARAAGIEPPTIRQMSRELSPRDAFVVLKILRELFRIKPRIVHTHKAKAGAVGRVAAQLYKWLTPSALWLRPRDCRVVHTYHGHIFHSYYSPAKTRFFLTIENLLARFCTDRIVVISRQQREEISGFFKVGKPAQYSVIPLGIDVGEMASEKGRLRESLGVSPEIPLVGIVGRLCEVKNHAMFLEAAKVLKSGGRKAHFVVIGDGHLRDALESHSRRLGLTSDVSFIGFREDAPSLYADLDLVALTSLNEGTPLTLIEAMGCGVAVGATEVGGVCDLMGECRVQNNSFKVWDHGVTAPSQDVQAFAGALKYLIDDSNLRSQMGGRGHAFVRSRLSKERLVFDIEKLYRELLGNRQD